MALNLYEIVTARIIAALESGKAPWRKPWTAYGFPSNYFRHHAYQGINALVLNFTEYEHPFFATLHQVNEHGGSIRKGAKAEQVYFFKYLYFDRDGQKALGQLFKDAGGAEGFNVIYDAVGGGYAEPADLARADAAGASGVAIADALHWDRSTLSVIKRQAHELGLEVRL